MVIFESFLASFDASFILEAAGIGLILIQTHQYQVQLVQIPGPN